MPIQWCGMANAFIFSSGIRKIPSLNAFLPEYTLLTAYQRNQAETILGWGLRPSTRKARAYAETHQLPFIALEDGFLRSLGLGVQGYPPFAMVVDDMGIYYDTSRPSRLEHLILHIPHLSTTETQYAQQLIQQIVDFHLSKYNHSPDYVPSETKQDKEIILVIDQTFGDMAIHYGGADETTFQHMFAAAVQENPQAEIWVKTHPDVLSGKKKGYLTHFAQQANVRLLADDVNPISLLKQVAKVYCVTSHMGFEALLCGKPVVVFGLAWYAGWGLTDDRHADIATLINSPRRAPRTLAQLFTAAYLQYSRYINPNTGETGTIEDVIHYLHRARQLNEQLRGHLYCVGMSLWKRAVMKPFFQVPACQLHFVSSIAKLARLNLPAHSRVLAWGNGKEAITQFATERHLPLLRMEDGFIRSVGLGSNLVPPLSLVIDDMGIYFNPQQPSRLEHILQHTVFTEHDQQVAQQLQHALTHNHISKYNVGSQQFTPPPAHQTVLLVIGQVEDDASIRYGSPQIYRNLDLLQTVRTRYPDAYIIYKPHPDVVSGNRVGHIEETLCLQYANQIAAETDVLTCLHHAHEVHTMTSLTGFEALLRGKTVYCYGLPFYAGWGLTHDELSIPRRQRQLELWQLIAATLNYYPHYIHPNTHRMIDALTAIDVLKQQKQQTHHAQLHRSWLAKQLGKLKQLYRSLRY